jgi:AcrR family transcriptional regulator
MVDNAVQPRREQILDAALAIADEQGLAAVTMRAVATRVGVSPMALYPHVGGKDGLLDGIVDRMLAELLPAVTTAGDAETRVLALARAARALARRHPTAYALLLSRPSVTPDAVRVVDAFYTALLELGVPPAEVPRVERLLSTFALGYATSEVNGRFTSANPRGSRGRLDPDEFPAHHSLAKVLADGADWDAEYEADLADLRLLIRTRWGNPSPRRPGS